MVLNDGSDFLVDEVIVSLKIKQIKSDKNLVEVEPHTVERKYSTNEELHVQKRLIQRNIVHEGKANATG